MEKTCLDSVPRRLPAGADYPSRLKKPQTRQSFGGASATFAPTAAFSAPAPFSSGPSDRTLPRSRYVRILGECPGGQSSAQ
jgi:hypothetical protein